MQANKEYESVWTHLHCTPFRLGFVDAGGVNTRYIEAGDPSASVVVMLHGTGGSWETFCKNIAAHAAHFRVLALDMVGNGFSGKPDIDYEIPVYVEHLRKFMMAMGVQKASLVGVSLGAWVAVKFASLHPEMTEKVTLMAASGLIANKETMQRIRGERSKAAETPTWESVSGIFKNLLHDPSTNLADLVAVRLLFYRLPEAKRAMAHILCLQDYEVRVRNLLTEAEWSSIQAPVLVIGSVDHDDDYLKTAKRVSGLLPRAKYVEMAGVNHWGHFEKPEVFNALILKFLQDA